MIKNFWIYGSDKVSYHNYTVGYYEFLKNIEVNNMLEIGICEGYSHRAWSKIFPTAKIFGIDFNPHTMILDEPNIITAIADQNNIESLKDFVNKYPIKFDFILDDGGHQFHQGRNCFQTFFPQLASDGVYIIEDILKYPLSDRPQQTMQDWENFLKDISNIHYTFMDCHYNSEAYMGSVLLAITKK